MYHTVGTPVFWKHWHQMQTVANSHSLRLSVCNHLFLLKYLPIIVHVLFCFRSTETFANIHTQNATKPNKTTNINTHFMRIIQPKTNLPPPQTKPQTKPNPKPNPLVWRGGGPGQVGQKCGRLTAGRWPAWRHVPATDALQVDHVFGLVHGSPRLCRKYLLVFGVNARRIT